MILCPLSIGLPSLGGARGSAPGSGGRWRRLSRSPALCEERREMAEVGSREQFGALCKVLQPGEPAVCLPEAGGPHIWSCPMLLPPCELRKMSPGTTGGQRGRRWGGGFERLTLRGVYTGDGTRKRLGGEVTWNQPNSCTSFVLTFESPQCPAFILGSGDLSATG